MVFPIIKVEEVDEIEQLRRLDTATHLEELCKQLLMFCKYSAHISLDGFQYAADSSTNTLGSRASLSSSSLLIHYQCPLQTQTARIRHP